MVTEEDIQVFLDQEDKDNPMTPEERDRKELEIRQRLKIPAPLPFGGRELPPGSQALWRQYTPEQAMHFKILTDRMADPALSDQDRDFIRQQRNSIVSGLTRIPTNPIPVQTNQQAEQQARYRVPNGAFGPPRDAMGGLLVPPAGFMAPPDQRVVGRGLNRRQVDALAAQQGDQFARQVFREKSSQRDFTYQDEVRLNKLYAGRAAIQAQVESGELDAITGLRLLGQIENGSHLLEAQKAATEDKAKMLKINQDVQRNALIQRIMNANAAERAKILKDHSWLLPGGDFLLWDGSKWHHIKPVVRPKAEKPIEDAEWLKRAEAKVRMDGGMKEDDREVSRVARMMKNRHSLMESATKNAPPATAEEASSELNMIRSEFETPDKNGRFPEVPPIIQKRAQGLATMLSGGQAREIGAPAQPKVGLDGLLSMESNFRQRGDNARADASAKLAAMMKAFPEGVPPQLKAEAMRLNKIVRGE